MTKSKVIRTEFGAFTKSSGSRLKLLFKREIPQIRVLVRSLNFAETDLFMDIGANIGAYSVIVGQTTMVKEIHAFEPSPPTFRELKENFGLQNLTKAMCHDIALSDTRGEVEFTLVAPLAGNNAVTSTAESTKAGETIIVQSERLDDLFSSKGRNAALKIDVEGHEGHVLRGSVDFLKNNDCIIQIELLTGAAEEEAANFFGTVGYRKALNIHNDHYFVRRENSVLFDKMRDFGFEAYKEMARDYVTLRKHAERIEQSTDRLVQENPQFASMFPHPPLRKRRVLPSSLVRPTAANGEEA